MNLRDLLVDQGIEVEIPEEAMKFITPKVVINEEFLLYILEVPKLEKNTSTALRIIPLIVNDKLIEDYPQYVIKHQQKLFVSSDHKNFVQRHSQIKEFKDNCIEPLVKGKESNCSVITETKSTVYWIDEDKILLNNVKTVKMESNCGQDDRNITGNFLITIWNCTVIIEGEKYQSYTIESQNEELQGALHNIQIARHSKTTHDINKIGQETIANRNQLQQIFFQQTNHRLWIWTLSGGLSLSSICIILMVTNMCARKWCKLTRKSNEPENFQISYNDLLKQVGIKVKVEDDFCSPQGGVTT